MKQILSNYAVVFVPIAVAIVSGIFYLIKKSGAHNNQRTKNTTNSNVNQANGNITIKDGTK